jgi:hypothetical protein
LLCARNLKWERSLGERVERRECSGVRSIIRSAGVGVEVGAQLQAFAAGMKKDANASLLGMT